MIVSWSSPLLRWSQSVPPTLRARREPDIGARTYRWVVQSRRCVGPADRLHRHLVVTGHSRSTRHAHKCRHVPGAGSRTTAGAFFCTRTPGSATAGPPRRRESWTHPAGRAPAHCFPRSALHEFDRYVQRTCGSARRLERAPQEVRSAWMVRVRRSGHDGLELRPGQHAHEGRSVHRRVRPGREDARVQLPEARLGAGADPQRHAHGRRSSLQTRDYRDDGGFRRPAAGRASEGAGLRLEPRARVEGPALGHDPVRHQGRR